MRRALLVGLALVTLACERKREVAKAGSAASASASASPPATEEAPPRTPLPEWLPLRAGEFVLDAHADSERFGGPGETPIAGVCELLASDCATLDALALGRALRVSYGQGARGSARVDVTVLAFGNAENAYAYFTAELAEAEALGRPVFAPLEADAAAVLGETTALVVRAEQVAELRFGDSSLPPTSVSKSAGAALAPLARAFGSALPGEAALPKAALLLPLAGRAQLGVRYDASDACGLSGVGPGARARYTMESGEEEELAVLVRLDEEAAEDVLDTLRKLPGSRVIKQAPYRATRVLRVDDTDGRRVEWVFGQKGRLIAGVGRALRPTPVPKKNSAELNSKIVRLKKLLDGLVL